MNRQYVDRSKNRLGRAGLLAAVVLFGLIAICGSTAAKPPLVPVLKAPANGATIQDNFPTFSWTASTNAYTYDLQWDTNDSFTYPTTVWRITKTSYKSDSSSIPNGTYYWRVMAWSQYEEPSGWSDPFKFRITGPYDVPSEFPDIRSAISAIPYSDSGEVLVAPGTYTGYGNCNLWEFDSRSVQLRSSGGPSSTIIDCQDSSRGLYFDSYTGTGTAVEGFTIRNATGAEGTGGAIDCDGASVTINNCVIEYCPDGGIFIRSWAQATITNCTIRNNYWRGVSTSYYGRATITGCTFQDNSGYCLCLNADSNTVVTNCDFISNQGNEGNNGNGAYVYNSTPTFQSCSFLQNEGLGLYCWNSNLSMDNCTFVGNTGHYLQRGGGIGAYGGSVITLTNSTFDGNTADNGAGIYLSDATANLAQCLFDGNTAQEYGGAVYVNWGSTFSPSGCTFVNNSAVTGSGVYIQSERKDITERPTRPGDKSLGGAEISECLFAYNQQSAPVYLESSAWIEIMCTDIYGNVGGDWTGAIAPYLGQYGNVSADPLFCDVANDDYSVTANSPVADTNTSCATIGAFDVGCGSIELSLSPASLSFATQVNGPNPAAQNLQINNLGGNVLNWTLTKSASWLQISSEGGTAPSTVSVSVNKTGLSGGVYYDTLVVSCPDAINSPQIVPVTLTVTAGVIAVEPTSLEFSSIYGLGNPEAQVLAITNDSSGTLFCELTKAQDWLQLSDTQLTTPAGIEVSIDIAGLEPGDYFDTIAVHSDDALNSPEIVPVTLTVVVNQEPSFISTCDDVTLLEGQPFECALAAQDPEGSAVAIIWNGEPSGATFVDNGDGTADFSFTPDYSDVDSVYSAIFTASDQLSSVADTLYIDVDNRQLIVDSMKPSPGQDDDILISDSIQIQFNEPIDEASLVANLVFSSAKGAALNYEYVPQQHYLLIGAATGHLIPLDTIGVTLNAGLNDLAGYGLDQTYVETFVTGAAVYPGDANDDGIVDERDVLPMGLYWGNTGPVRGSVPDLSWAMAPVHVAFQGERWDPLGGVFADADGSGIVEANDICGITDNWTMTHTISEDGKNDDGASLVTSLDGVDESVLQALYQAVLTCPESQGRNILRESLEAALGQPATEATLPTTVELYQNYPNPFNPFTTIRFYLPSSGRATLSIYNMLGQRVATLIDGHVNAGYMEATWDATDATSHEVASGIYFYRLETTDFSETRRMMLLK